MTQPSAHIVWNEDRTEGVIFVDDETQASAWPLSASDDAYQASTGRSRRPGLGSALAEAFFETYDHDDERPVQQVSLTALRALSTLAPDTPADKLRTAVEALKPFALWLKHSTRADDDSRDGDAFTYHDGSLVLTFGHLRRARRAYAALIPEPAR